VTLRSGNIRRAVRDVVDGAMGPYASRLADLFEYQTVDGVFKPGTTKPLGEKHAYDVELGELGPHEGSPMAARGSFRIATLLLRVKVETKIPPKLLTSPPPQNNRELRDTLAQGTTDRLDLVAQSLATPGTLTYTAAAEPTGIISGLLRSPDGSGFPEVSAGVWDFEAGLLTHEIRCRALVQIDRP